MDIFRRKKFDEAMFAKNRTFAIRVGRYQSSDIKEAHFDYGYIKGDTYKPGGTCAGSGKITFTSIITTFNKLDKIYPEVGLLVDGTYEWVKMGEYFINDIEIDRNRKTTKLDLMDEMFKLNREHVTDLTYPAEIRHVIKEICLKTGIELANENMDITSMNYRIDQIPKDKKMTFRDVLSLATQMLGMSCFFNREGKLEIKELTDSGITITADSYFMHGLTKSEIEYQIAGITCKKDKETLTVGLRTGRSLELDNLFMSQAVLDNLYHKIKDIRYYPFNLNYQGHLLLNVGEWVTIKTNTGETFKSPILSQSFTFKGGLRGRIGADSKAGNDAQYSYAGTLTKKIEQFNDFEAQIQNQIEEADKGFDQRVEKIKKDFSDQVELAKAKAEEVKRELSDTIDQRFSSFNNGPLQEAKRRAEEALRNSGASSLLAQEAKRIGLDSIARLEEFKRQATSAQTALSGDLDVLKRTIVNDIRPKQAQAEADIAKQVEALNRTKNELVGVKSAQATFEQTTTLRLAELTNLADGKASKSELTQTAEELKSKIASVRVGGINLLRNTASLLIGDSSKGYWMSASGGNGRAISVEVLDPPKKMIKNMIRVIENTNGGNKDLIQLVRLRIGEKYTISCYARVASDSSHANVNLLFRSWANNTDLNRKFQKSISHKNWQKYSFTFTADAIENSIQFGQSGAGIIEICAPKIESGTLATDYSEDPEDIENQISALESTFKQRADSIEAGVNRLTEGLRAKADISSLNVTAENIRQSVKSLEKDTQNKLNQKLNLAEFEVRAGSIRQEILDATKDKADKTLVIAEAGKLREEFSKMKVGSRNYAEDYDFSRGLWRYHQGDSSSVDWKIINGEYHVKGTTKIWKQMQIFSKEGSRVSEKNSTALLELEIGETYTLSFQGICYSGSPNIWVSLRANRTAPGNPEIISGNFTLTSSWQTYQVTIPALTKPDNFDFWRIILGYNEIGHVAFRKVELTRSSTRIDAGPAPEDGKTDLVIAKSEFQKTAEGLSTKLAAVETYVNQDSQRQEALRRYTREESARQATAVRELVTRDYVGKASHQEDVRGIERRLEAITNPQNGTIATQIAKYKTAVDGRFAEITSMISGKANQTDFQLVRETSQLYERILGNSENGIVNNVARMALTNQLFQVEVAKAAKGGRNYIRNGQFKNGSKNWIEYQSVNFGLNFNYQHSKNPDNRNRPGLHFYHESQDVANFFGIQQSFAFEGVRGEKVSVSLLVSKDGGDSNSGLKVALHYIKNKNIIGQEWQNIPSPQITSKYKRFIFTFTLSDDVENLNLMLYGEKGKTINLYVTDVQLERGSVATDYKEASEDTDEAIRSVQTQLNGSWSVQNINSAGDLISGINLGADGRNRVIGKSFHITGETLIDNAVIKSAMVDKLKTANFEAGSVTTVVLDAEAVTAEKLKVDQAFFNKLVANEAYLNQLFAKQAFINRVQSVAIDASQVRSGILSGDRIYGGTIRGASIYGGTLTGHTQIQLGSYGSFDTVNGGLQINVPRDYNAKDGLGVQFIGSYGRGENVPYGLFLYRDSDFTIGNTATDTDEFLMTVQGYINAKGIGWLKTGKGSVNGKTTGTIGFWNSDNVSLSFGGSGNDIYYSYNSTAYSLWSVVNQHFSDRRLKENIVDCKHKALDYIQQFQFKEYDWKKQEDRPQQAHTKIGLIAQEVQTVDPTLVYENGDTLNLDNLRLTNIALKAIQELALENQKITHRLENLENEYRTA
jgi:hypothetical protein